MATPQFGEPVSCNGHVPWHPPEGVSTGLMVYNSLTDSKVPFKPVDGMKVKWYTCGPTVYDVCHMGHARAYLTFDILRRIMEDYFNYQVQFAVNVTDIDDKIIKRARTNKLLEDYISTIDQKDSKAVCEEVHNAALAELSKAEAKLAKLTDESRVAAPGRDAEAALKLVKEQELKVTQAKEVLLAVEKCTQQGSAIEVVKVGSGPFGEHLDQKFGDTVTDHEVFNQHARKYERMYLEDMDALGVRRADVQTRVSEYVPQVVEFVEKIIAKGCAYASNGSVYFDTAAFKASGHDYPKLKVGLQTGGEAATEAEMAEGEGTLSSSFSDEKRSASDFALWKRSKAGEPAWDSPWGPGRPGWHIECSVMASDVLGSNMDIHAGGSDLRFPHHDNELAQSEACHGCSQWVNYFLHAGHLNIHGLKMSKSLKNFITIRQALAEHTPRQLRLLFLQQAWDKSMLYSDQVVDDAKAKEALFKNFFGAVKASLREDATGSDANCAWREEDKALNACVVATMSKVHAALSDNFDTAAVIMELCNLVSEANKYMSAVATPRHLLLRKAAAYVTHILRIFGVVEGTDEIGFPASGAIGGGVEAALAPHLNAMVAFRDGVRALAREHKLPALLELCDSLRDTQLVDLGVRLEDRSDGPSLWKLDDPATLRREVQEKKEKAAEAAAKKAANKLEKLRKESAKWAAAAVPPEELFKAHANAGKYSEFDENNLPTKLADGTEVSKKQQKNNEKEMGKHVQLRKQLEELGGDDYMSKLCDEIAALELEVKAFAK